MKVDYRLYISSLIEELLEDDTYVIHLIPHVIAKKDYNAAENDIRPCTEIKEKFSNIERVICAPSFENPIEAKSYISNNVLMVGDSVYDFEGAAKVGVDFIGVLYGFGFKKEDVEFYSSKIEFIREPKELLNLVTTEIVK